RPGYGPLPHRRALGVLGEIRTRRQGIGGQEERQQLHWPRQPLPGPDLGQRRRGRRQDRHPPPRAVPADPPPPPRPESPPRQRPPGRAHLRPPPPPATPPARPLPPPRPRPPPQPHRPRPPPPQPRPPARSTRLHRHPRTHRLTSTATHPAPLRSAGCCRAPANSPIFGSAGHEGSIPFARSHCPGPGQGPYRPSGGTVLRTLTPSFVPATCQCRAPWGQRSSPRT